MDASQSKRPAALITLAFCLLLLTLGGFAGAYGMLMDSKRRGHGASLSLLENTPVSDYLLPGLFLLVVFGIARWRPFTGCGRCRTGRGCRR